MAHPVGRLPALVAGMAAVLALSGCGSSTDVQSASITPVTGQTQAVATAQPAQSTSKAPAQADREVLDSTFFLSPDGNIACSIDMNMGVRCDIIYADWPRPPRPADCQNDYGHMIAINPWIGLGKPAEFICAATLSSVATCHFRTASRSPPERFAATARIRASPAAIPKQATAFRSRTMPTNCSEASARMAPVYEFTEFRSPSSNVVCYIEVDYLRCDIAEANWSPPPRPGGLVRLRAGLALFPAAAPNLCAPATQLVRPTAALSPTVSRSPRVRCDATVRSRGSHAGIPRPARASRFPARRIQLF